MEEHLHRIAVTAPTVVKMAEEHTSAIDTLQKEEAGLLAASIETVRPALSAITYKIKSSERTFWPDSVTTATEYESYQHDGLRLAGAGPTRDYPSANDGQYEGRALYLLEDGSLVNVRYTGTWTRWQGRSSGWEAQFTPVTCREAMDQWEIEECVRHIATALQKQVDGKLSDATEAAKSRAAKLSALAELLKK